MDCERAEPAGIGADHPLAERMGVIAAFSHNIIVGTVFGSFSPLVLPAQHRLGISPDRVSFGWLLVVIGSSILAAVAGALMTRLSLRLLLAAGAAMAFAGFVLLAFATSYPAFLIAYGVLLGPAVALSGIVGPATLVTRWFSRNRGLALGLAHVPLMAVIVPLVTGWIVVHYGAQPAYLVCAGLAFLLLPLTLLAIDFPPASSSEPGFGAGRPLPLRRLLAQPAFWALAVAGSAVATGAGLLGTVLVRMAPTWGLSRPHGAVLAIALPLSGIAGSVVFGWLADRLGGVRGLMVLCFNLALLWTMLLLNPGFPVLAILAVLLGMHGAGMIPNLSRSLSDTYGTVGFSVAYGMATALSLPLMIAAERASMWAYGLTGSFSMVIAAMIAIYVAAAAITMLIRRDARPKATTPA